VGVSSRNAKRKPYLVLDSQVNADGAHVWPFDTNFPIDIVQHSLSGRQPFRMNRHDYFEIAYLNSGELVWQIQDRMVKQGKGDLFVMGSPTYHRLTERSSAHASVLSLFFDPGLFRLHGAREDAEYLASFQIHDPAFSHVISRRSEVPREIRELLERIQKEWPAQSDRARLSIKTYVKMIMVLLLNHYAGNLKIPARFDRRQQALDRFKPLFTFLDRNSRDSITPADAARIVNMSPSHFRRAFKQVTGQPFVLYLNHFRVARAQTLLAKTEQPISDIGLEVGFCDQSYFGLIFRRIMRMTPRQYREHSRQPGDASAKNSVLIQHQPGFGAKRGALAH